MMKAYRGPHNIVAIALLFTLLLSVPVATAQPSMDMTDQAICDKIDDEFGRDPAVDGGKIDVTAAAGIVTLIGSVDNLLAKERAARIARAVRGVKSVINRLHVQPHWFKSDEEIKTAVERALLNDPATDSYEVAVSVAEGMVTLNGTVDSYQEQELCLKVAKSVSGVQGVHEDLRVVFASDRPAHEIESEIKARLKWNVLVDDGLIQVAVDPDGNVTLSGTVGSAAEKRRAAFDAHVAGVKSVDDSNLEVDLWQRDERLRGDKYVTKSGDALKRAIESAFMHDPRVNSFNLYAEVLGSSATLRGVVDNLKAKRAAEQDARNTVGVRYVTNRIKVRPASDLADQSIQAHVEAALLRNALVDRYDLTVKVYGGEVHLYGTVDSYFEKVEADDVASRIAGVVDVKNHLQVNDNLPYAYDPYVDEFDASYLPGTDYQPPHATASDADLKAAIENELWWSPYVRPHDVQVAVTDGRATLTGTVVSYAAKGAATDCAFDGGATWVDNDLVVEP